MFEQNFHYISIEKIYNLHMFYLLHLKLKTRSLLFHWKHLLEFKETLINFQNLSFWNAASMSILDSLRFR